jgi:hypothetical protein
MMAYLLLLCFAQGGPTSVDQGRQGIRANEETVYLQSLKVTMRKFKTSPKPSKTLLQKFRIVIKNVVKT